MQPSVAEFARRHATDEHVDALDIGGRDVNGHARGEWPNASWTVLDLRDAPEVDIVADARSWTPDKAYGVVLCTEMLEHVERWQEVVATAASALRPGGLLVVTAAGPGWGPHSDVDGREPRPGEWFEVVTADQLGDAFAAAGLDTVEVVQNGKDSQGAARKPAAKAQPGKARQPKASRPKAKPAA